MENELGFSVLTRSKAGVSLTNYGEQLLPYVNAVSVSYTHLLVIGLVSLCSPFVYLSVIPRLKQMYPQLYEAALDLGCSSFGALRKVVLPQLTSGIVSGFMMSITLTLDDYFITTYTKPSMFDTISTYVVNATKGAQTDVKTALWALSTIIFLIVIFVVIGMNHTGRKENDHEI